MDVRERDADQTLRSNREPLSRIVSGRSAQNLRGGRLRVGGHETDRDETPGWLRGAVPEGCLRPAPKAARIGVAPTAGASEATVWPLLSRPQRL